LMSPTEDSVYKKKDFQRTKDDDLDLFLTKKDKSRVVTPDATKKTQPVKKEEDADTSEEAPKEVSDEEHDEQIKAARTGRAQAEAYHDVAVLRKKAHDHSHRAAKFFHRYKTNEAKRQKCSSRAVAYREKADARREKAKEHRTQVKEYDMELRGAAQGKSDLSPEALRNKMARYEKKAAKADAVARKFEAKAADQTEKAAKYRTRAAKFLEKNKLHESEARMYGKRADNLEKA
jgi:hypothetical protein